MTPRIAAAARPYRPPVAALDLFDDDFALGEDDCNDSEVRRQIELSGMVEPGAFGFDLD